MSTVVITKILFRKKKFSIRKILQKEKKLCPLCVFPLHLNNKKLFEGYWLQHHSWIGPDTGYLLGHNNQAHKNRKEINALKITCKEELVIRAFTTKLKPQKQNSKK